MKEPAASVIGKPTWLRAFVVLAPLVVAAPAALGHGTPDSIPTFTNVTVHDPSVLRVGGEFYVFGSHLASARTPDWRHWTQITTDTTAAQGNALVPDPQKQFREALDWVGSDTFWAPDVIRLGDGRFRFYYCIGRLDAPIAALGMAISDSITGPYTNVQLMLRSGMFGQPSPDGTNYDPTRHPNTVDPDVSSTVPGSCGWSTARTAAFILELDRHGPLRPVRDMGRS